MNSEQKAQFYRELLTELEFEEVQFIDDQTKFKELEEWDSMSLLIMINFFKSKLSINLTPQQISDTHTLGELF